MSLPGKLTTFNHELVNTTLINTSLLLLLSTAHHSQCISVLLYKRSIMVVRNQSTIRNIIMLLASIAATLLS
jgi:hypothetical protein